MLFFKNQFKYSTWCNGKNVLKISGYGSVCFTLRSLSVDKFRDDCVVIVGSTKMRGSLPPVTSPPGIPQDLSHGLEKKGTISGLGTFIYLSYVCMCAKRAANIQ